MTNRAIVYLSRVTRETRNNWSETGRSAGYRRHRRGYRLGIGGHRYGQRGIGGA